MTAPENSPQDQEEQLRRSYAEEPWGKLAIQAGWDPVHTESAARQAFAFGAERIEKAEAETERYKASLTHILDGFGYPEANGEAFNIKDVCEEDRWLFDHVCKTLGITP